MPETERRGRPQPRLPFYYRLREEFAGKIAGRDWKPGETIPAEAALARAYGAALGTVRKAIESLVAEGLLERRQGKGTFVRKASFDGSLLRFFRFQPESGAAVVPKGRILKREVIPARPEVARHLAVPEGNQTVHLVRLRLLEGDPLLLDEIWLPRDPFAALLDIPPDEMDDALYPLYERQCGQVIAYAQEELTAEPVSRAHARLLAIPPGTPVIVIERCAFAFDHRVLEWRRSRGRADRYRYRVEIR
jgi:GntR family transcriptional regulator